MASKSKAKGNTYERELVQQATQMGIQAIRAWGSNGRSLGLSEEVDCLIAGYKVQAKRRAKIADYMVPSPQVDVQIIRGDRGSSLAVIPYELFLSFVKHQPKTSNNEQ